MAVLAIIANGGRVIIVIDREAVQIIIFSCILLILLKSFDEPLAKRLPGVLYVCPSKLRRWRGKRIHHGGDICVLVFS